MKSNKYYLFLMRLILSSGQTFFLIITSTFCRLCEDFVVNSVYKIETEGTNGSKLIEMYVLILTVYRIKIFTQEFQT